MRLIVAVYDALRSFDRPCTRAEIERQAQLTGVEAKKGLLGLKRRGDVLMDGAPRQRTLYRLRPGAQRPADRRGRYERLLEHRQQQSIARRNHRVAAPSILVLDPQPEAVARHSPASPPSHTSAPGGARLVTHGMDLGGSNAPIAPCALAQIWRRR